MNLYSQAHIQRIYDRGVEAVVRLVYCLTDKVEDMEAQLNCKPQPVVIASLSKQLAKQKRTLARKTDELRQARQLNHQLLRRIRELEHEIERGHKDSVQRDSHNSSLPPALDPPWNKIPRTRSLRHKSGLKAGGQLGHPGTTLRQVAKPDCVITHTGVSDELCKRVSIKNRGSFPTDEAAMNCRIWRCRISRANGRCRSRNGRRL